MSDHDPDIEALKRLMESHEPWDVDAANSLNLQRIIKRLEEGERLERRMKWAEEVIKKLASFDDAIKDDFRYHWGYAYESAIAIVGTDGLSKCNTTPTPARPEEPNNKDQK